MKRQMVTSSSLRTLFFRRDQWITDLYEKSVRKDRCLFLVQFHIFIHGWINFVYSFHYRITVIVKKYEWAICAP